MRRTTYNVEISYLCSACAFEWGEEGVMEQI